MSQNDYPEPDASYVEPTVSIPIAKPSPVNVIQDQNVVFKQALNSGQINQTDYNKAMLFQNQQLAIAQGYEVQAMPSTNEEALAQGASEYVPIEEKQRYYDSIKEYYLQTQAQMGTELALEKALSEGATVVPMTTRDPNTPLSKTLTGYQIIPKAPPQPPNYVIGNPLGPDPTGGSPIIPGTAWLQSDWEVIKKETIGDQTMFTVAPAPSIVDAALIRHDVETNFIMDNARQGTTMPSQSVEQIMAREAGITQHLNVEEKQQYVSTLEARDTERIMGLGTMMVAGAVAPVLGPAGAIKAAMFGLGINQGFKSVTTAMEGGDVMQSLLTPKEALFAAETGIIFAGASSGALKMAGAKYPGVLTPISGGASAGAKVVGVTSRAYINAGVGAVGGAVLGLGNPVEVAKGYAFGAAFSLGGEVLGVGKSKVQTSATKSLSKSYEKTMMSEDLWKPSTKENLLMKFTGAKPNSPELQLKATDLLTSKYSANEMINEKIMFGKQTLTTGKGEVQPWKPDVYDEKGIFDFGGMRDYQSPQLWKPSLKDAELMNVVGGSVKAPSTGLVSFTRMPDGPVSMAGLSAEWGSFQLGVAPKTSLMTSPTIPASPRIGPVRNPLYGYKFMPGKDSKLDDKLMDVGVDSSDIYGVKRNRVQFENNIESRAKLIDSVYGKIPENQLGIDYRGPLSFKRAPKLWENVDTSKTGLDSKLEANLAKRAGITESIGKQVEAISKQTGVDISKPNVNIQGRTVFDSKYYTTDKTITVPQTSSKAAQSHEVGHYTHDVLSGSKNGRVELTKLGLSPFKSTRYDTPKWIAGKREYAAELAAHKISSLIPRSIIQSIKNKDSSEWALKTYNYEKYMHKTFPARREAKTYLSELARLKNQSGRDIVRSEVEKIRREERQRANIPIRFTQNDNVGMAVSVGSQESVNPFEKYRGTSYYKQQVRQVNEEETQYLTMPGTLQRLPASSKSIQVSVPKLSLTAAMGIGSSNSLFESNYPQLTTNPSKLFKNSYPKIDYGLGLDLGRATETKQEPIVSQIYRTDVVTTPSQIQRTDVVTIPKLKQPTISIQDTIIPIPSIYKTKFSFPNFPRGGGGKLEASGPSMFFGFSPSGHRKAVRKYPVMKPKELLEKML